MKQGRLLTLHAVTCILAWNARRAKSGRDSGCLDQEGMQEDLVGMFRRAFESGLQTVRRRVRFPTGGGGYCAGGLLARLVCESYNRVPQKVLLTD